MINEKIKKQINKASIISFDIFDTLIIRMVNSPSDVYEFVEKIYNNCNSEKIYNFKNLRIDSEKFCRRHTENQEIKLDEIYDRIGFINKNINVDKLKKIEIDFEMKICKKNMNFLEIYNYCLECKKRIILCSDMYLPKNIVEKILKKNEIIYDELYISSDKMKTKSKGTLYKYILKKEQMDSKKILHIGDNLKSDYIMARLEGFRALLYKKMSRKKYDSLIAEYFINNSINDIDEKNMSDYFYSFGYKYLGMIMLCFCKYLSKNIPQKDKIIFLSREGQFIKKCFDELNKNNDSKYMYVSRKSVSGALLHLYDDIEKMIDIQSLSPMESVESFLNRWDILNIKNRELLKDKGLDISKSIYDSANKKILQDNLNLLKNNCNTENKYILFTEYLKQFKIDNCSCIVDIGWNGTMQDLIQKKLDNDNIVITGYYLGLRFLRNNNFKYGFLFNGEKDDVEILTRSMTGFIEILFSASHGTTYRYEKLNGKVEPIIMENDISEEELNLIKKIQTGCIDFLLKYSNDEIINLYDNLKEVYIPLFNFCIHPQLNDIKKFEAFKVTDEKKYDLIGNNLGFKYLIHPKHFINDYVLSCWKNGFLKSIFKINLPYSIFFKIASKRRK